MSLSSFSSEPNPFGFALGKVVVEMNSEFFACVERMGKEHGADFARHMFDSVVAANSKGVELQAKLVGAQYAYSRTSSSSADGSERTGVSSVSGSGSVPVVGKSVGRPICLGLAARRADNIARLKTWRSSSAVPDGFCYSKLMRNDISDGRVVSIGAHPTLASLVRLSAADFKSLNELSSHRLIVRNATQAHVTEGGKDGLPLLPVFKSYVERVKVLPGSFGELLKDSNVPRSAVEVNGRCHIGGEERWRQKSGDTSTMVLFGKGSRLSEAEVAARWSVFREKVGQSLPEVDCYDFSVSKDWCFLSCDGKALTTAQQVQLTGLLAGVFAAEYTAWGALQYRYL